MLLARPAISQLVGPPNPAGWTHARAIGSYQPIEGEGSGQIWDFSSAIAQQTFGHVFTNAATSLYSKTYPDAEWQLDEAGVAMFYSSTSDLTYYGGVQQGMVILYDDPETAIIYPTSLGDSHQDTFGGSYNGGIEVIRTGTTSSNCIASGSLALPGGVVFSEAYRVQVTTSLLDSTSMGNYYLSVEADFLLVPEWPLAVYGSYTVTSEDQISGTPPQTTQLNSWMQGSSVGVEAPAPATSFVVYPSPVSSGETITLMWSGAPSEFRVLDALGNEVLRQSVSFGVNFSHLVVDDWSPGVYFIEANEGVRRLVVQ